MNKVWRQLLFVVLLFIFLSVLFSGLEKNLTSKKQISLSESIQMIKEKKVDKIIVHPDSLEIITPDKQIFVANKESNVSLGELLKNFGFSSEEINALDIEVKEQSSWSVWLGTLLPILIPIIFLVILFSYSFRRANQGAMQIFSFSRSNIRLFSSDKDRITFKDVAGLKEAKEELQEIVEFLKNPKKFQELGARIPRGVLLMGAPGSGKTLLARAVAGEANVPFFHISGSEFVEMFVGVGAGRVRDAFNTVKKAAPAILFIDEIDAIGRERGAGIGGGQDEREQTLNQILVEMDGFTPTEQVVVIAATNRGDLLDTALLRPGRFDRRIVVDYPDLEGRKAISKIHARGKPFTAEVDWDKVAKRTVGFSGADLENMLNEAAIYAARNGRDKITMEDIEEAATKVKLGPEKKRLQSDLDKKLTAYHEAGHAIISHFLPHTDPVHRISIVSRGMALGFTLIPPARDKLHETKTNLLEKISVMMGGRAAEQLVFNEMTTGAANDFDQATQMTRSMVVEYGMSELGPINYGPISDVTEWGKTYLEQEKVSQSMMAKIDQEIKKIIDTAYKEASSIIQEHREKLDAVAGELIKRESLDQEEFEKIVGKKQKLNS